VHDGRQPLPLKQSYVGSVCFGIAERCELFARRSVAKIDRESGFKIARGRAEGHDRHVLRVMRHEAGLLGPLQEGVIEHRLARQIRNRV